MSAPKQHKRYAYPVMIVMAAVLAGLPARGEVVLDGTMGPAGSLSGPDFAVTADLGRTVGGNLFHSFSAFSVGSGESAVFSGPATIDNIIGRVTGGSESFIDGPLRSTIPAADLYLLNPAGLVFGPNAALDISGSFHASTADYLKLTDGGRFDAAVPENTLLSSAAPAAFGFLGGNPAGFTIDNAWLAVGEGEAISLVGGDIRLAGEDVGLSAPGGTISMVSVASGGEVGYDLSLDSFADLGTITLSDHGYVSVSGAPPGEVFIRGGRLLLDNSSIYAGNSGDGSGGVIDIAIRDEIRLANGSIISAAVNGWGDGAVIDITTDRLTVTGGSYIRTLSEFEGWAGDIYLWLDSLHITDNGRVESVASAGGEGGQVVVEASGSVTLSGDPLNIFDTFLGTRTATLTDLLAQGIVASGNAGDLLVTSPIVDLSAAVIGTENLLSFGRAGDIYIATADLGIHDAGLISSASRGFGAGGDIFIIATGRIGLTDPWSGIQSSATSEGDAGSLFIETPLLSLGTGAKISAETYRTGNAGDIDITAGSLSIVDGGVISSDSLISEDEAGNIVPASGKGGDITIDASEKIILSHAPGAGSAEFIDTQSSLSAVTFGSGSGGTITLNTPLLEMDNGRIYTTTFRDGKSGAISVETGSLLMTNGARIDSSASFGSSGEAGDIAILADGEISVSGSAPSPLDPEVILLSEITSSTYGSGAGGTITLTAPRIEGEGCNIRSLSLAEGSTGNIDIHTGTLSLTGGAQIDSTSRGSGPGGRVTVDAERLVAISGYDTDDSGNHYPSGIFTSAEQAGQGGDITITAPSLRLSREGAVSAKSSGTGYAGNVTIDLGREFFSDNGDITTEAVLTDGGDITLRAGNLIEVWESEITAEVGGGPRTTGGNIRMSAPDFVLADSRIIAQAYEGRGGNINLIAETFLSDFESLVSASSALGIDGVVEIEAQETDVGGNLVLLPESFLDASALLLESCSVRAGQEASSLIVGGRGGMPVDPAGLQPSPYGREQEE